jgi:hypothetical protein
MAIPLSDAEVKRRLRLYSSPETTTELYSFGSMLVAEIIERIHRLEAKAGTLAGYAGAILALIVTSAAFWGSHLQHLERVAILLAALSAFASECFAILAIQLGSFEWFSDNEWLREECLSDAETLRKYHILTMRGVIASHRSVGEEKTKNIERSQWFLGATALFLLTAVFFAVFC